MDNKCPRCGSETRPEDNFCLICGYRLTSTPQQAEASGAEPMPAGGWSAPQGDNSSERTVYSPDASASAVQTAERSEQPARFILRAESGEILQEYTLDKPEITIGRAPNSDILLSKDKLTSRRHATVRRENGTYSICDERSANGTFVNGQQLEEMIPCTLHDGDHIGVGEHELIFRTSNSSSSSVEDLPTIAVSPDAIPSEETYRTQEDELATTPTSGDEDFRTVESVDFDAPATSENIPNTPVVPEADVEQPAVAEQVPASEGSSDVTLHHITDLSRPGLPTMTELLAALSALDGHITNLQEQLNATQSGMNAHDERIAQVTDQLRANLRRICDRMDTTIAEVARNREDLAWGELSRLMEDVINNPRDIEYVTKLARKTRDIHKIFQVHQNVLNVLAECNSQLRSLIGE